MLDVETFAHFSQKGGIELGPVSDNYHLGYAKPGDDVFPEKVLNVFCGGVSKRNCPTKSIPHMAKRTGLSTGVIFVMDCLGTDFVLWHESHLFMKSIASARMMGQCLESPRTNSFLMLRCWVKSKPVTIALDYASLVVVLNDNLKAYSKRSSSGLWINIPASVPLGLLAPSTY
ncbi:hypothetical protein LIER_24700 [Lithospermum erythrorhizon]|uniref:Uncharacterized protein n=1 Tax=Lithospermum erythrorhizon TaxID=34254 RepID=A0AAV3R255_LITER